MNYAIIVDFKLFYLLNVKYAHYYRTESKFKDRKFQYYRLFFTIK